MLQVVLIVEVGGGHSGGVMETVNGKMANVPILYLIVVTQNTIAERVSKDPVNVRMEGAEANANAGMDGKDRIVQSKDGSRTCFDDCVYSCKQEHGQCACA